MTSFAQPDATPFSRSRLQLAATLVLGIAIGSIAATGLINGQPAGADSVVQAAPAAQAPAVAPRTRGTTSASEQYQAWYTRRPEHRASTTAGEQYRAWYTAGE